MQQKLRKEISTAKLIRKKPLKKRKSKTESQNGIQFLILKNKL
jgi:hypothetical protein